MNTPHEKSGHITKVQDLIMQSPLLHWSEKLLYYSIRSLVSDKKGGPGGEFEASKETLAKMVGLSIRTIQRLLKKWRESGYLEVREANRFKPVKYALREEKLMASVLAFSPVGGTSRSVNEVRQTVHYAGQPVAMVSHADVLVGLPVIKVGQSVNVSKTESPSESIPMGEKDGFPEQEWRTPEKDDMVKEMGRKMNEISGDISTHFVVDEKWLRFLTRDEYNHLVKISGDLKGRSEV